MQIVEVKRVAKILGLSFSHTKKLLDPKQFKHQFSVLQLTKLNTDTGGHLTQLVGELEQIETDKSTQMTRRELSYLALDKLGIDNLYDLALAMNRLGIKPSD